MSLSLIGNKRNLGKKFSKEWRENISTASKGKLKTKKHLKNIYLNTWGNEEIKEKMVRNMLKNRKIYPNEQKLLDIIEKNNLPFNYVGNGKAVFNGFCPDFLSKNPQHIIELFGGGHYNKEGRERNKRRVETYSSLGYKTLIIANGELKNEEKVVEKIKEFIK
jgi:very-short-patch-repair endonuclease